MSEFLVSALCARSAAYPQPWRGPGGGRRASGGLSLVSEFRLLPPGCTPPCPSVGSFRVMLGNLGALIYGVLSTSFQSACRS